MDDLKRKKLSDCQRDMMQLYDRLVDLSGTGKRRSEQEELLLDAMDSLEEAISCLEQALEP